MLDLCLRHWNLILCPDNIIKISLPNGKTIHKPVSGRMFPNADMDGYMNSQNNAHEMEIKLACARWVQSTYVELAEGVLINEFSANRSKVRADLACVTTNEIIAIEIKSKSDNTSRLARQVNFLKKIYNRVDIVVTKNHLKKAKEICVKERVGLHLYHEGEIKQILKGRRRKINFSTISNSIFPQNIKSRADFSATEDYYRAYLINKYSKHGNCSAKNFDGMEINSNFIRKLNIHYTEKLIEQQKTLAYRDDLEALLRGIQSTQSSSNSSAVAPTP